MRLPTIRAVCVPCISIFGINHLYATLRSDGHYIFTAMTLLLSVGSFEHKKSPESKHPNDTGMLSLEKLAFASRGRGGKFPGEKVQVNNSSEGF